MEALSDYIEVYMRIKINTTIERYLISEFLLSFLICFLFYIFIFLLNQILLMAETILLKGLPFNSVMLLIIYALPSFIPLSVPFATLTSCLMCYGRLSSDNELLAMRSVGFQRFQIFRPVMILGILITAASLIVNDTLIPIGNKAFQRLWLKLSFTNPGLELEEYSVRNFDSIYAISGKIDKVGIEPLILINKDSSGNRSIAVSRLAVPIPRGGEDEFPGFRLYEVFSLIPDYQNRNEWSWIRADYLDFRIVTGTNTIINQQSGPSTMRILDVRNVVREKHNQHEIELLEHEKSVERSLYSIILAYNEIASKERAENMVDQIQRDYSDYIRKIGERPRDISLQSWTLEYYQKFAIPLSSIPFIFLGFPLGSLARKSGRVVGFFFGLLLSSVYWSILIIGRGWGLRGLITPFVAMVLPNILLLLAGILFYMNRAHE